MRTALPALFLLACATSSPEPEPSDPAPPETAGSERPTEVAREAEQLCRIVTEETGTGIEAAARIIERFQREITHPPLRDAFIELLGATDPAAAQRFRSWLAANGAPGFVCRGLDRLLEE
jgi:hypothetical protein